MNVSGSSSQYNPSINIQEQPTEAQDVETENKVDKTQEQSTETHDQETLEKETDNTQEQQSATQTQKGSQSNNNRDPYDLNLDKYADKHLRREVNYHDSLTCCATCCCPSDMRITGPIQCDSPTYSYC